MIYLVTQPSGKETIHRLKGDIEFGVEVFIPEQIRQMVNAKLIDVVAVIEAPIFNKSLIIEIDHVLAQAIGPVPLVMIPEYGFSEGFYKDDISAEEHYRKRHCKMMSFKKILFTGFNQASNELGILLTDILHRPSSPHLWVSQLDEKIRVALLGETSIQDYQASTDFAMQYSHDSDDQWGKRAAGHFLSTHVEFANGSMNNQDVLMIGERVYAKQYALKKIVEKLIKQGYARISFLNIDKCTEDVLYQSCAAGKTYRVLYTAGISHPAMIACCALSGPLIGATGDQSFAEALSAHKIVIYERLDHKVKLIRFYRDCMRKIAAEHPQIVELINLLACLVEDDDYKKIGLLLNQVSLQQDFRVLNQRLLDQYNVVNNLALELDYLLESAQESKLHSAPLNSQVFDPVAILEGRLKVVDPVYLPSANGFYWLNSIPIGSGGWANVYAAHHYSLKKGQLVDSSPLAIKLLSRSNLYSLEREYRAFHTAYPDEHSERFYKKPLCYLAMPLFKGVELDKYLQLNEHLTLKERQSMVIALLSELRQLHEKGIVHLDLKPKNILYDACSKKMRIIDFGCAEYIPDNEWIVFKNIETSVFAFEFPPEYLSGVNVNPSLDVYAMAPIIAEILGISKRALVSNRMIKPLKFLSEFDDRFAITMKHEYANSENLEEALLLSRLTNEFGAYKLWLFVRAYTVNPYDFELYQAELGHEMVSLLKAMQDPKPDNRPSAQRSMQCILDMMEKDEALTYTTLPF